MGPKTSVLLWKDVHEIADKVCTHFQLSYGKILPVTKKLARYYGYTYCCGKCKGAEESCQEKILEIRIHRLNSKKPLAASTIIRTLAHELAHLREWKHGPAHKAFETEILKYILELGYVL